jgi:hypothetical protein
MTTNICDFYNELRADFSADPSRVLPDVKWYRKGNGWQAGKESDSVVRDAWGFGGRAERLYTTPSIPGCLCFVGGGSVPFERVMGRAGLRGAEWVEWVRELAGLLSRDASVLDKPRTPEQAAKDEAKARSGLVLADAWVLMLAALRAAGGAAGRKYMAARAVDITDDFPVGWCPSIAAIRDELVSMGYSREDVEAAGLKDSRWDGRVVLAWTDARGCVRAFQARRIDNVDDDKYLYAGSLPGVYGLPDALQAMRKHNARRVVVVEGVLDVLVARRTLGDTLPIIATGNTFSRLSAKLLGELRGAGVGSLVLATDNDKPGRDALLAMLPKLADTADAPDAFVIPPESYGELKDPDAIMTTMGYGKFADMVAAAIHWPRYVANVYLADVTPESPDVARVEAVGAMVRAMGGRCPVRHMDADALDKLAAERTGFTSDVIRARAADEERRAARERAASELATAARELRTADDVAAVVARARDVLGLVDSGGVTSDWPKPSEWNYDAMAAQLRAMPPGLHTGWAALDDEDVAFRPGELSVIAARTSHGKTAILIHMLCSWLQSNAVRGRTLFYSHEEQPAFICSRMIAWLAWQLGREAFNGSAKDVRRWMATGKLGENVVGLQHVKAAQALVSQWLAERVDIVYRPRWTADQIEQHANAAREVGLVMCDYLQRIQPPSMGKRRDVRRDMEVSEICRRLKAVAADMGVPVIAAAQLNRDSAARARGDGAPPPFPEYVDDVRGGGMPRLEELREGGSEQEADMVLAVMNFATDYPRTLELSATPFDVGAIKNRYGRVNVWSQLLIEQKPGVIIANKVQQTR